MVSDESHPQKPLLYVDVDGVISLFGFASFDTAPGPFHDIDGSLHCIRSEAGALLIELAEWFDLVWATGWENLANVHLPQLLGLPFGPLPTLTFDGRAVFGSSHWKLDAITAHSSQRPVAWIDDNLDDSYRLWALSRDAPTLLVDTSPSVGLTRHHVKRLCDWACSEAVMPAPRRMRSRTQAA